MTRTQLASYCLIASALIIGAMVIVQASRFADNTAKAEMVVNKDLFTLVTTQYSDDSEILYVLDSRSELLLAYMLDPNQQVIKLLPGGRVDLPKAFEQYTRGRGAAGGGTPYRAPR